MSAAEVREVGLSNLGEYISTENGFVIAVREYRVTDFSGYICTNVFTSFESEAMDAERCTDQLKMVVDFANSCSPCLTDDSKCDYNQIDEQCTMCLSKGCVCVSMAVMHVLWDMGSSHKKSKVKKYFTSDRNAQP